MAIVASVYGKFALSRAKKLMDLSADGLKLMATTNSYVPDVDAHQFKSDVTNEVTGTGYTAGGKALTGVTLTYDAASNKLILDADDPTWTTLTVTGIRKLVLYDDTPSTDATKPLIGWIDLGADNSPAGVDFQVRFNAGGIWAEEANAA